MIDAILMIAVTGTIALALGIDLALLIEWLAMKAAKG